MNNELTAEEYECKTEVIYESSKVPDLNGDKKKLNVLKENQPLMILICL